MRDVAAYSAIVTGRSQVGLRTLVRHLSFKESRMRRVKCLYTFLY